jgi:Trypsin-co-occurring domain 1
MTARAFIPSRLADGTIVMLEVAQVASTDEVEVSSSVPNLEPIWDTVSTIANTIGAKLSQAKAKKAVVEFGIEFAAESGGLTALLVKGTGKANVKITLEWS